MKRKEIYSKFLDFFSILKDAERADDQAILGDVMGMISDSFAPDNPNNMNLPD